MATTHDIRVRADMLGDAYEILHTDDPLGSGTYGVVYLARRTADGALVAVKLMDKRMHEARGKLEALEREIKLHQTLVHANVIRLLNVVRLPRLYALVLELARNGELYGRIARSGGQFTEENARHYFRQLIEGVGYCHDMRVAHRDLKLENLLLDDECNLKIADFGFSVMFAQAGQEGSLSLRDLAGTLVYVAPEILDTVDMDWASYSGRRADIWSCGVILYVVLAGCYPFEGSTIGEVRAAIRGGRYEAMPSRVSREAHDLVRRMLVVDAKRRLTLDQIRDHPWVRDGDAYPVEPNPSPFAVPAAAAATAPSASAASAAAAAPAAVTAESLQAPPPRARSGGDGDGDGDGAMRRRSSTGNDSSSSSSAESFVESVESEDEGYYDEKRHVWARDSGLLSAQSMADAQPGEEFDPAAHVAQLARSGTGDGEGDEEARKQMRAAPSRDVDADSLPPAGPAAAAHAVETPNYRDHTMNMVWRGTAFTSNLRAEELLRRLPGLIGRAKAVQWFDEESPSRVLVSTGDCLFTFALFQGDAGKRIVEFVRRSGSSVTFHRIFAAITNMTGDDALVDPPHSTEMSLSTMRQMVWQHQQRGVVSASQLPVSRT